VDLSRDNLNCGKCFNICTTQACCPDSNGQGQCINVSNDNNNCGACGQKCPADRVCEGSSCVCRQGVDCGGVCTDTSSDTQNCGACGHVCGGPGAHCSNGTCACPKGFTNCNDTCVILGNDTNNCGACGHKCPAGMACDGGFCVAVSQSSSTQCIPGQCTTTQCLNFDGECTGLNGPRSCVSAPGAFQCCDSNIFFGEHPWVHVCTRCISDPAGRCLTPPVALFPSQGCGVCY
jgi:hypothetical protein